MEPLGAADGWIDALGPGRRTVVPFEARKSKTTRRVPPAGISQIEITYRGCDGPIGPWREHFGKGRGQVYPLDGMPPEPSCNEIEVVKLLRRVKQEAFWVSCYSPSLIPPAWRPWVLAFQEMPPWLKELDRPIRRQIASKNGGIPDVVAWDLERPRESAVFVECKGPKEAIGENQEAWVSGAIAEGLSPRQVAVAVRIA
jgi:hypothetical protein